jgi:hypothetical protein
MLAAELRFGEPPPAQRAGRPAWLQAHAASVAVNPGSRDVRKPVLNDLKSLDFCLSFPLEPVQAGLAPALWRRKTTALAMQGDQSSRDKPRPSAAKRPLRRALALLGLALLGMVAAYVSGRIQAQARLSEARQQVARAVEQQKQGANQAQSAQASVLRLESRRRLHLALMAMEERNFGIAQQHLGAAGVLLGRSNPGQDSDLGKLGASIREARLVATEDLGTQRQRLLGWVQRFDRAVPPKKPE